MSTLSLISSCASEVIIPDIQICVVRGDFEYGANCATSNSNQISELNLNELIHFIESDIKTNKGPAVILPIEHFTKLKTSLEQLCRIGKTECTKEMLGTIRTIEKLYKDLRIK